MSNELDGDFEVVIDFREAYARKEKLVGKRIPLTQASRESGISYSSFYSQMNGQQRAINLDVLTRLMDWLGTTDFNDIFKRREGNDT